MPSMPSRAAMPSITAVAMTASSRARHSCSVTRSLRTKSCQTTSRAESRTLLRRRYGTCHASRATHASFTSAAARMSAANPAATTPRVAGPPAAAPPAAAPRRACWHSAGRSVAIALYKARMKGYRSWGVMGTTRRRSCRSRSRTKAPSTRTSERARCDHSAATLSLAASGATTTDAAAPYASNCSNSTSSAAATERRTRSTNASWNDDDDAISPRDRATSSCQRTPERAASS
mmetsp:Transcript_4494/g.16412  ORF Transcript_4494/g.16412 Transcript_4494/m.16412 type:complete len:233 (+) Transcript_4494:621-1319(+)